MKLDIGSFKRNCCKLTGVNKTSNETKHGVGLGNTVLFTF